MRFERAAIAMALAASLASRGALAKAPRLGLGRPATPAEVAAEDLDVRADGRGLPPGGGDVAAGEALFAERCQVCHGERGGGGAADALAGGRGTLTSAKPLRTVGSYWPYATTLFDYVRRAMPYDAPGSLSADQVYALSAYILWVNGIVPRQARLDRVSLPKIDMPNRHGFIDGR